MTSNISISPSIKNDNMNNNEKKFTFEKNPNKNVVI